MKLFSSKIVSKLIILAFSFLGFSACNTKKNRPDEPIPAPLYGPEYVIDHEVALMYGPSPIAYDDK